MPQLIILRGLPGSGKTTWARDWCDNHPNAKRINKDDLRAMFDDGVYTFGNEQFINVAVEALIAAAHRAGKSVVIDDTNINPDHIRDFTELGQQLGYTVRVFDIETPMEVCIERDAQRPRPVGAARIREMHERLAAQHSKGV